MVSGMMTGSAAAPTRRASMDSIDRTCGCGHLRGFRPARAHEFRGQTPRREQPRVDGLRGEPEHGGGDAAGGDIDQRGHLHPTDHTVVDFDNDIPGSGVDLHELPGRIG